MAPTAPDAILCGDPARALTIAQEVLVEPRMSNHHRGLWSYHGELPDGTELTVQATGIGGTSAAIVLDALAARGLQRAIRVGTARARGEGHALAELVAPERVWARDGASAAYGAVPGAALEPDPGLFSAIAGGCDGAGELVSLGRPLPVGRESAAESGGAGLYDLQSAALLAAAREHGVAVGIGVVIVRNADGPLEDEPAEAAVLRLAGVAASALAAGRTDGATLNLK
ncbi:MAG TPA: hypothetical protein VKA36_00770 [Solirubrobacterales bacterium]|nr:hypothetical protein [Solirubrobacterales bacterium]